MNTHTHCLVSRVFIVVNQCLYVGKNDIFTPCLELHSKYLLNMVIKRSFIPKGHEHAYKVLWNFCLQGEKVTDIHGITVSINSFQNRRSSFILCYESCRMLRELHDRWPVVKLHLVVEVRVLMKLQEESSWAWTKQLVSPSRNWNSAKRCYQVVLSRAEQDDCYRTHSTRQFRLFKLQEGVLRG